MTGLWRNELLALIKLSIPVVTVQIGMMAMGFVDVVMVGHLPEAEAERALAAVGVGNFYNLMLSMFGIGVLMALDPILSQAIGAKDVATVGRNMQRGLVLAAVLSVPTALACLPVGWVLRMLDQPSAIVETASDYVWILTPGILPFLLGVVFRLVLQGHSRVAPIVWMVLVANAANIGLNWLWVFGNGGFPAMGATGSAWATLICRWFMPIGMLIFGWPTLRQYLRRLEPAVLELAAIRRVFWMGVPLGLQLMFEFGAFGGTLVFMGWFANGELAQSGHQVAITLATFSYMFPLGVSFAASVRVGYGIGTNDMPRTRAAAGNALIVSTVLMLFFAAVFLLFPDWLARQFTKSARVQEIAATLLPVAGVFQVVDGLQVIGVGICRGLADTRAALEANILGFWVIGIPAGLYLAFPLELGPAGLWWGLVIGLTVVAVYLLMKIRLRLRGAVQRTIV